MLKNLKHPKEVVPGVMCSAPCELAKLFHSAFVLSVDHQFQALNLWKFFGQVTDWHDWRPEHVRYVWEGEQMLGGVALANCRRN